MIALLALLLVTAPAVVPDPIAGTHHVLVLDDSGSMETDYDVHGFALAVPELFQRMVGEAHPELLTVLTLAQGAPNGPVPHLEAADYLGYPRENGTFYTRAIAEALRVAHISQAPRIEIALVTDAEPDDERARAALDDAMREDPRIHFSCFQLGTTDPGDLCVGHTSFAKDGFDMARLMASHLAATMGSIPRWGRIDRPGTVAIPLGRFVHRVHLLLFGARAGEDFAGEVVRGNERTPIVIDHTRPMMIAAALQMAARTGPRSPMELPLGVDPRLALGTLTFDVAPSATPELHITRSDGPVAWGVMLEYDLEVGLEAPAMIEALATAIPVRAHLLHKGVHVDDVAALNALGLVPELVVVAPDSAVPLTIGPYGWSTVNLPAAAGDARWTVHARYTSATASLSSQPMTITRVSPGTLEVSATPTPPPVEISRPAPTPIETPGPTPAPAPTVTAWLPPTLDLPPWSIEQQLMTYTLTVTTTGNKALSGAEIAAQHLTAALSIDGVEVPMTLTGDRFEVTRQLPLGPTTMQAELVLRYPGGEVRSAPDRMDILPDAVVRLVASNELGTIDAGCDAEAACTPLDLLASHALERTTLRVTRTDDYDLTVTLMRGDERYTLRDPVDLKPSGAGLEVCVAPPGCSDIPDDAHAAITIAPADARLATPDRIASTRFVFAVTPSTWLDCNLWWCLIVAGGLMLLFIVWGYVRPHAFPSGAFIQVADQERRLAKDPGRPLRSVPHGRRGFYRTATCAIDPSGFTVKRTRPHVVQLRADRGRIALMARGSAVERRQRGQWVPIDRRAEPFLMSGATYRVNQSFVFRVLA